MTDRYATAAELGLMQGFPPPPDKRVDRGNALMTPPYNRWSYLHMRAIYPSAPIRNGDEARPVRPELDGGIAGLTVPRPGGGAATVEEFLRETYTDALLVATPDRLVFQHYDNGMHARQAHQMMSCTKSFAGLFALMAVHDGRLSEDQQVTDIVPELAGASAFAGATVGQVLDMVNSMAFNEDYADPASDIARYVQALGWMDDPAGTAPATLYDYLATLQRDPAHRHGEVFHYQTPKTDVVNWLTNRVTGRAFQDALSQTLWAPLGTDGETYVLLDRSGTLVAGGGLNAAPADLIRFAQMILNDGEDLVPTAVLDTIQRGGDRAAFAASPEDLGGLAGQWSYRAQWWVRHTPGREAFSAIGIHGQWVYIDRGRGVAIVKQSSQPVSSDPDTDQFILNAFDAVIDHVAG